MKSIKRHNILSVQPWIAFNDIWSEDNEFIGLQLLNNGLGPAIIDSLNIFLKGDKIDNWFSGIYKLNIDNSNDWLTTTYIKGKYALKANSYLNIFGAHYTDLNIYNKIDQIIEILNSLHDIRIKVYYSTFYGESKIEEYIPVYLDLNRASANYELQKSIIRR